MCSSDKQPVVKSWVLEHVSCFRCVVRSSTKTKSFHVFFPVFHTAIANMLVLFWMLTLLHFAQRIWTFVFSKSHTCLLISLSPFFFSESLKLLQIWWSVAVKSGVCAGQSVTFTLVFVVVKTKRRHRPSFAADFQNLHTSFVFSLFLPPWWDSQF